MALCPGVRRTRFHAVSTKNASRVINVVYGCVSLARGNPGGIRIFRCFDVNTIGRAGRSAQKASHTLLEPTLVAMQHVNSAVTRLEMHRLVRIVFRHRLPENVPEG